MPNADLVAIDLPGHGANEREPCTPEAIEGRIEAAVAGALPGQPVMLVGHSLGGYLAAWYTARAVAQGRDVVDTLVLIGSTGDPASVLGYFYQGFARALPRIGYERMTRVMNALYWLLGQRDDLPGPEAYASLADAWTIVFEECGPRTLARLPCRVWLVNGQFDQMRIHSRRFLDAALNARARIVPWTTHLLPVTHPEALAAILDEAIDELCLTVS